MADQPYTLENPEPREVQPEVVEETVDGQVANVPSASLNLDEGKVQVNESRVQLDEAVSPDDPNAVIVPPEGRGVHPDLGIVGKQTPEQALASGDAPEATGVLDGENVTAEEADKKLADEARRR